MASRILDGVQKTAFKQFTINRRGNEMVTELVDQGFGYVDITLTSAQLLAIDSTPVTVFAAPGANKTYIPLSGVAFLDYNTTAYVSASDLLVGWAGSSVAGVEFTRTALLQAVADYYQVGHGQNQQVAVFDSQGVNQAMTVRGNAAVATGDSPVHMRIWYQLVRCDLENEYEG